MISLSQLQGHWVRHWIKAPGFEDHKTRVHWMQVGMAYADVRIPHERPSVSTHRCLADLSARDLAVLAQAEGFAGDIALEGSHCTWHRRINWHGHPDAPDVGDIRFDAEGRMIEAGVLAEYTELWERTGAGAPRALRFCGGRYEGYLMSLGKTCVLGIGRPDKPTTKPLVAALQTGEVPHDIATLFDGVHAIGHWSGNAAIADLATQPFAEGQRIVTTRDEGVTWHRIAFDGQTSDFEMTWDRNETRSLQL